MLTRRRVFPVVPVRHVGELACTGGSSDDEDGDEEGTDDEATGMGEQMMVLNDFAGQQSYADTEGLYSQGNEETFDHTSTHMQEDKEDEEDIDSQFELGMLSHFQVKDSLRREPVRRNSSLRRSEQLTQNTGRRPASRAFVDLGRSSIDENDQTGESES